MTEPLDTLSGISTPDWLQEIRTITDYRSRFHLPSAESRPLGLDSFERNRARRLTVQVVSNGHTLENPTWSERKLNMCVSCGCGTPEDKHGDDRNITLSQLNAAAEAAGITVEEVVENIEEGATSAAGGESTSQ